MAGEGEGLFDRIGDHHEMPVCTTRGEHFDPCRDHCRFSQKI